MAELAYIQIIRQCNQTCRICSNPENGQMLSLEDGQALLVAFKEKGYDGVILSGGEPTLHPNLPDFIQFAHSLDLPARIITNGQKTADPAYLHLLIDAGLKQMHLSVHSHRASIQADVTENRNSLANIIKSLFHCRQTNLFVTLNQAIFHQNATHLDQAIGWFIKHFPYIQHISWTFLDPYQNRVADHPETLPTFMEAEKPLQRAMQILQDSGRTFRVEKLPLCYMGVFAFASTETRKLVKNEGRRIEFLDERHHYEQACWYYGKPLLCKTCSLDAICAGVWDCEGAYDPLWVRPQTTSPQTIIDQILHPKHTD